MNKIKFTRIVLSTLSILIFAGFLFRDLLFLDLPDALILVYALIGLAFSYLLCSLLHEIGHLVFGLSQGMRAKRMFFAWFLFDFDEKTVKLQSCEEFGYCTMTLKRAEHMERKFFVYVAGGLFFSLLYLVFTVFCALRTDVLHFLFGYGLPVSLYLFLFNAIPLGNDSDGSLILSCIRKDGIFLHIARALVIQSNLEESSPSEIDESLFDELPVIPDDHRIFMVMTWLRYLRALDLNDKEEILRYDYRMRDILEYQSEDDLEELYSSILYDCCVFEQNEEGAKGLFERQEPYLIERADSTACRILSAYHETYGDETLAESYRQRGIELLSQEKNIGIRKLEEKLLYKRNA